MAQNNKAKGLNLKNVIAFLGEHGADENTIRMVEAQCSGNEIEQSGGDTSEEPSKKTKQSKPAAEASAHSKPRTAKRKKAAASTTTFYNRNLVRLVCNALLYVLCHQIFLYLCHVARDTNVS